MRCIYVIAIHATMRKSDNSDASVIRRPYTE